MNELKKKFGLITAICMVAGIVIGSGVFFKAAPVFENNGGDMIKSLLTVLSVGVLMAICAYTFSILAGKYSNVNGLVDYAEYTVGDFHAYSIGWFMSVVYYPIIAATLSWVSSMYTCTLFNLSGDNVRLIIAASYLILTFIMNMVAPRLASKFQVSTTVIKLIPILTMAIAGTIIGLSNGQTLENLTSGAENISVGGGTGFFGAVVAFAFAYEGWIIATCINAELHEPKKNLPRALILGTVVVIAVYLAYFVGVGSVLSSEEIIGATKENNLPQIAFTRLFGGNSVFGTIAYVFIIISCLGTTNGVMVATCRGFYALAARNQGPAPKKLAKLHDKWNMPVASALIGFAIAALWMLQLEFSIRGLMPTIFAFSYDEVVIITLYALYIPIFVNMMIKSKELHPVKRFVFPALSLLACGFMIYSAFVAYDIKVFYYLL